MKMPDSRRAYCTRCHRHKDDVGDISWRGKCLPCGLEAMAENVEGLATRSGEPMRRWRLGMIKCAGGFTLDDLHSLVQGGAHD